MKKIIITSILALLFIDFVQAQSTNGFVLKGKIEGLKHKTRLYLVVGEKAIDSTFSKGTAFTFKGKVEGEANYYFIIFDSINLEKLSKSKYSNALWLVNSNLNVTGNLQELKKLKLTGSNPQQDYEDWLVMTGGNGSVNFHMMPQVVDYLRQRPSSMFAPYILTNMAQWFQIEYEDTTIRKIANAKAFNELCDNLSEGVKAGYWGQKLANKRRITELADKMAVTNKIVDFKITGSNGSVYSVYDIAKKNKLTLLDFWASWCGPCRKVIPELKLIYDEFHEKGFEILGISSDKNVLAWKNAIEQDQTNWTHALDNIDGAGNNIFGFSGIPAYILIDQDGRILQTKYFSDAVSGKLQQIFPDKKLDKDLREILQSLLDCLTKNNSQ